MGAGGVVRRLAEQGNHCDHHRDLGGIWNLVAIAIAGERIVSEFSPDLPGIPTCDTPTRLCAEPRSRARRLGSRPFLAEMSTDPESSLRVLYAYGANSKILTLAYFLFSNELSHIWQLPATVLHLMGQHERSNLVLLEVERQPCPQPHAWSSNASVSGVA